VLIPTLSYVFPGHLEFLRVLKGSRVWTLYLPALLCREQAGGLRALPKRAKMRIAEQSPCACAHNPCTVSNVRYEWNPDKNEALKRERNISFEQIVFHLSQGDVWKTADHPNQEQYPGQKLYFVNVEGYIHIVPCVVGDEYVFLKTIIPSRKATRDFQKEGEQNEAR